ncbi:hypothetical protein BDV35DRAFT_101739 [Aspergillus flavus]|uniref:Uncharacterized protein n=1 Tax=Aspergillus flavus TaxID=5059 RepID=A0A5N6GFN1_ASPFL|nr:hypothetical protein BDV35DRAFT_101739 [Aspergillus flavus]
MLVHAVGRARGVFCCPFLRLSRTCTACSSHRCRDVTGWLAALQSIATLFKGSCCSESLLSNRIGRLSSAPRSLTSKSHTAY